ncbi:hypothetical protein NEF87_003405 [Candidatus Lokiarchaeum ossiferum]|uniref:Uncharacterized protein n=1 Tax=Candidatus Lokiarchaeum ossiferum TaxID=2951803 RepID=A0ABY6HUM5_9ARCH|nr:hypothetical protein NEF87_003405 [Candidatus Lokiarchaeum sp. B-35]
MVDKNENFDFDDTIDQFRSKYFSEKDNLKSISIRGVNAEVYEQFVNKTKDLDMNVGMAVSKMMKDVVDSIEEGFPQISAKVLRPLNKKPLAVIGHENLTVTKQDLIDAANEISFINIKKLSFAPDVDKETFQQYILKIINCHNIRIPNIFPKLVLLSKLQDCKNIDIYEVD